MAKKPAGTLIIIGGHEDKQEPRIILKEVARRASEAKGKLVVVTAATKLPEEVYAEYVEVFTELGVGKIAHLNINNRMDCFRPENVEVLRGAAVIFFTGGDQLRITSQMGDSPVYRLVHELYADGATIAGTSAGASVMSATMIITGPQDQSSKLGDLNMAPGFALIHDAVIDQHFAERGRIGRLLAAVAQNPRNLGIGIDENTAIVVHRDRFEVLGEGSVYVADGSGIAFSNLYEDQTDDQLSCFDVRLHVLKPGNSYNLLTRRPGRNLHDEIPSMERVSADGQEAILGI